MTENLFKEFSEKNKIDWLNQVSKEAKQPVSESMLASNLWDKIDVLPFYTREDLANFPKQFRFHPKNELPASFSRHWNNLVCVLPDDTNHRVLEALDNGAEGLILHLNGLEDLAELLAGVLPQYIPILIQPVGNPIHALKTFLDWVENTGAPPESISGGLIWTPSDVVFELDMPLGFGFELLSELLEMTELYPAFKPFCLKTSRYTDSGGNPLDALVFGLGEFIEVADVLDKSPDELFSKVFLEVSVGENHFGEISRLRALRKFVSEFSHLYSLNLKEEEVVLLCITSHWSKSILDVHTTMIRQTYEGMSAVFGGANWLWIKPLDEKNSGELERRIARNVSAILREESHLDKVQDPAAGSYYLEKMTNDILQFLKNQLQKLESTGGFAKHLERGEIHQTVRINRGKIQLQVLEQVSPKIGVNRYPAPAQLQNNLDFQHFSEKKHELNPSRAAYLVELQTLFQP